LSDPAVIRKVAAHFVPVAVNLYKIRKATDAGGDLFHSVQRQKDQYQGLWIVSPEGKVLAAHHEIKDQKHWSREVLDVLDAGLQAFGPVTARQAKPTDPLPHRGVGVLPDGTVTLAVYTRYLHQDRRDGPAVLDTLPVSAQEWSAFAPPEPTPGADWALPEAVARQLCRGLSPSSDQSTMPRPGEVTAVHLTGRVVEVKAGVAQLRYSGEIAAQHNYEGKLSSGQAQVAGVGEYDVKAKRMQLLLLVFEGTHRSPPPYDKSTRETGAVVEWAWEKAGQ
jgi:hypothetical protein